MVKREMQCGRPEYGHRIVLLSDLRLPGARTVSFAAQAADKPGTTIMGKSDGLANSAAVLPFPAV